VSPGATPEQSGLQDAQGRHISYLRLSLTDRCNFRCQYCSPSAYEDVDELLTREELARLARLFARLGVRRVRLTGGEPTLRREILEITADLRSTPGIDEVALTTNGHRLSKLARPLREAGLGALNVSLDTLDPEKLERISGRGAKLADVLGGIDAAVEAGFEQLETNTVVMAGVNDGELGDLVRWVWSRRAVPRFIEQMPFAGGQPVPTAQVKRLLTEQGIALQPEDRHGWGPAHYMRGQSARGAQGGEGHVGFIGAITENFCERCNRVRLSSSGDLQVCLGGESAVSLREPMRSGASDAELEARVRAALGAKRDRHHMEEPGARLVLLPMMRIGG
jgi:cyclic pyranopterin phosphate synthase